MELRAADRGEGAEGLRVGDRGADGHVGPDRRRAKGITLPGRFRAAIRRPREHARDTEKKDGNNGKVFHFTRLIHRSRRGARGPRQSPSQKDIFLPSVPIRGNRALNRSAPDARIHP